MNYKFKPVELPEIENKINKAIKNFLKTDLILLIIDSSERSIAHKFAEHLQREFEEWNVDCEYNRENHDFLEINPKRLKNYISECTKDKKSNINGSLVYPDIIIHHRLNNENLLVIELKKTSNDDDGSCDKKKLKKFIKNLKYQYGLFINFNTTDNIGLEELELFPMVQEGKHD
jgi:hypothetical protein